MHEQIPEAYFPPPSPRKRPLAWVTWLILGSTVAVFILQLLFDHLDHRDVVGDALAFSPKALAEGHYWTLLTYAWAHAVAIFNDPGLFWLHIVANMVMLYCFGPALEEFLGHGRFLGLYLGGTVFSAIFWWLCNFNAAEGEAVIGASGAIYGLIAAAGTASPRARIVVYVFYILPIRMSMGVLAVVACLIELIMTIPDFDLLPGVAHSAHLGGALFGFLYILIVRLTTPTPRILD